MRKNVIHTLNFRALIKSNFWNYSLFVILALIILCFGFLSKGMNLSGRNITNILFQSSYVLILAVGMAQCIIIHGIDLSVSSVCIFIGILSTLIYNTGGGIPGTVLGSLLIGFIIGAFQGWFIAYHKVPAFIVTLAGMWVFRGLTYIVTNSKPVYLKDDVYSYLATGTVDGDLLKLSDPVFFNISGRIFNYFPVPFIAGCITLVLFWVMEFINRRNKTTNGFGVSPLVIFLAKLLFISILICFIAERFASYRGFPIVVIVLAVTAAIFHFIINKTVLGRYIYAIGSNAPSSKLFGINTEFITFIVYCFMGILAGLAGVISTGLMNFAYPSAVNPLETGIVDAIAACYIGGVSTSGNTGSVIGVIVGGLIMGTLNNGMALMNLNAHYQLAVKALFLLLAVFFNVSTRRKTE